MIHLDLKMFLQIRLMCSFYENFFFKKLPSKLTDSSWSEQVIERDKLLLIFICFHLKIIYN